MIAPRPFRKEHDIVVCRIGECNSRFRLAPAGIDGFNDKITDRSLKGIVHLACAARVARMKFWRSQGHARIIGKTAHISNRFGNLTLPANQHNHEK